MKVTAISDLHGYLPELPGGDLLLLGGDYTARDEVPEWDEFYKWLKKQSYEKIVYVGGNHDGFLSTSLSSNTSRELELYDSDTPWIEHLCDSGITYKGVKIWGSPWTTSFEGINPKCTAFTVDTDEELQEKWELIPQDVDILLTHSPMFGIHDTVQGKGHVGSWSLYEKIREVCPKYHICGHVHEHGGKDSVLFHERYRTQCYNTSYVDEYYHPTGNVRCFVTKETAP